jgi:hypothetical protein
MGYVTQVITDGTHTIQQSLPSGQLAGTGQPAHDADRHIHDQADEVVANKQARDLWEAVYAERMCGCPRCRQGYKETLAFYGKLGTRKPPRERISAGGLAWCLTPVADSQLERR